MYCRFLFHQKNIALSTANATSGTATPIAAFAPVDNSELAGVEELGGTCELFGFGGEEGFEVGGKSVTPVVEDEDVEVVISVLSYTIRTPYAFIPAGAVNETTLLDVLLSLESVTNTAVGFAGLQVQ